MPSDADRRSANDADGSIYKTKHVQWTGSALFHLWAACVDIFFVTHLAS